MRAQKFTAVIGINKGHFHKNNNHENKKDIYLKWQSLSKNHYESKGIYVSANISKIKTIYHEKWGCPLGGEVTYEISGICNPVFSDSNKWREVVLDIVKELKLYYEQSSCSLEFCECEFYYLT